MKKLDFSLLLFLVSFVLCILTGLYFMSSLNELGLYEVLNSDALYMASLYRDLFIHGNELQGWNLNTTSLLFPNFLIFSFFAFILEDLVLAHFLHGITQFLLLLFVSNYLLKKVYPAICNYSLAISNFLICLLPLYSIYSGDNFISINMFLPYHIGAYIISLLCFTFLLDFLLNPNKKYLYFISFLTLLMTFSDRIFILFFSAASIPLLVYLLFDKNYRRKSVYILSVIIVSAALSLLILRAVLLTGYISFHKVAMFRFDQIIPSFQLMINQYLGYISETSIKGLVFKLSLLSFLMLVFFTLKTILIKNQSVNGISIKVFLVYSLFFVLGVWVTPAMNGIYYDITIIRYNIYIIYLLLLLIPFFVEALIKKPIINKYLSVIIFIAFVFFLFRSTHSKDNLYYSLKKKVNIYPEDVRMIDSICLKHNLKNGSGNYWAANRTTFFSKNGIKIRSSYWDLNPYLLNTNANFYVDMDNNKRGGDFDFVIIDSNDIQAKEFAVKSLASENFIEIPCKRFSIIKSATFYYDYGRPYIIRNDRKLKETYNINIDTLKKLENYTLNVKPLIKIASAGSLANEKTFSGISALKADKAGQAIFYVFVDSTNFGDDFRIELKQTPIKNKVRIKAYNDVHYYYTENKSDIEDIVNGWGKVYLDFKTVSENKNHMQIIVENCTNETVYISDIELKYYSIK